MTTTFVGVQVAQGFDYARYRPVDLDELLERKWPTGGADLYRAVPMKITVNLAAYGEACPIGFLKKTMQMMGSIWDDAVPITRCVNAPSPDHFWVSICMEDWFDDSRLRTLD